MTPVGSLRARLMVTMLAPLAMIACVLGYWRYTVALDTTEALFDRSLLATTLAISRDVTVSGGDALSITTRDLIAEAAGGQVYYHVSGPDRAYLTGYAYPPVPPEDLTRVADIPTLYESVHQGAPVRALRLVERSEIGQFRGLSTVTVWQLRSERRAFARLLARRSAILLGTLLFALALIIWFGVNFGLRPLRELENAIAARTSDDLSRIRRFVPREVQGVVARLNELFAQVREAMSLRDAFISDAAHQLRNPVAGMLALAEAAETASSDAERKKRLGELTTAAQRMARLTTQMLAFDRIRGRTDGPAFDLVDLDALLIDVSTRNADRILNAGIAFEYSGASGPVVIRGDRVMLEEAIENLIDNAMRHGGPGLTRIEVRLVKETGSATVSVIDDGRGLAPSDSTVAFERFGQVHPSDGSGLGLAIVSRVAAMHETDPTIDAVENGTSVSIRFNLAGP
ncbi:MAG: sensor histidine kinase [Pseudomonadota bacterium]